MLITMASKYLVNKLVTAVQCIRLVMVHPSLACLDFDLLSGLNWLGYIYLVQVLKTPLLMETSESTQMVLVEHFLVV